MKVDVLPLYKCHKVVRAAKIEWIDARPGTVEEHGTPLMSLVYGTSGKMCGISAEFIQKHNPEKGGYMVVYEDGYLSYSPADVFEAGYHELPPLGTACGGTADVEALAPANTGFQWRKKPVVIEAYQWKESDSLNLRGKGWPHWLVAATRGGDDGSDQIVTQSFEGYATIKTLEGEMRADIGDWIIYGVKGELYPCKPDIFAATYEPADEPATNMVGATGGPLAEIDLNAADFSDAVMWLKEGRRVARAGWPSDKHLIMSTCMWSTHSGLYEQKKIQCRATNSGGDWSASSDDMLATDWVALN